MHARNVESIPFRSVLLAAAVCIGLAPYVRAADDEDDFRKNAVRAAPRDAFPVLNDPRMVGVAAGNKSIQDSEPVIGIDLGGEQKAYPVSIMGLHELVNDSCGKQPIAASW